ncbi:MAG: alpha/beta fold hydrolase [Myxococcota bacterium]
MHAWNGGARALAMACVLLTVSGCGDTNPVSSGDEALFRRPRDFRAEEHAIELPSGDTMHYTTTGPEDGKPILFVHGYPASPYLYRNVVRELCAPSSTPYRCISIALIGFGRSSCPGDGRMVTPTYEADRVDEFIEAIDLHDFVAVVHDWGGPIGTAAALRHADAMSHLVILNTFFRWFGEEGLIGTLTTLTGSLFATNRPVLETFSPAAVEVFMQVFTNRWLGFFDRLAYAVPFADPKLGACRVRASIGLFNNANDSGPLFNEITERLANEWRDRPAVFLWATDDPLLGPNSDLGVEAHADMVNSLPQADTILIEDANHFMQEDQPRVIAHEIDKFLKR